MKRKILVILVTFVNIFALAGNIFLRLTPKPVEINNCKVKSGMLSMMLETDTNSKTYIQSTSNDWPTDGYMFNEEMSKCEQGSALKWDDTNKKVVMEGNSSDKCYVFFDKYNPIKINNYSITSSGNKITITIDATSGTGTISKYYYSKDDGVTYVESTSNNYVFTSLDKGTYKVKAYVEDSNGKMSEVVSKTVEVSVQTLASWIKKLYTGTQGENNLYYHDASLVNGAGDNSYRYAGSNTGMNNYICLKTSSDCSVLELFRIIGVIDGKVKVIRDKSIGQNAWDSSGSNVWSTSSLNSYFNTTYYNTLDSTLKEKIADTTWSVGGNNFYNISREIVSIAYKNELITPATSLSFTTKIGLMYTSDYGYAALSTAWTSSMANYSDSSINSLNWMVLSADEWTITRSSGTTDRSFTIYANGSLSDPSVTTSNHVRPCFNLLSSVTYKSGTGDKYDPILIN